MEQAIQKQLKEFTKNTGNRYTGTIRLTKEDFTELLGNSKSVRIDDNGNKTLFGLQVIGQTDQDIGWEAMEFTGWDKNHPELVQFIKEIEFRKELYLNQMED